jgi:hypothetical protein
MDDCACVLVDACAVFHACVCVCLCGLGGWGARGTDHPFGARFRTVLALMYQRLFRVYAHLYCAHYRQLEARAADDARDLNTSYVFFVVFAL